MQTPSNPDRAKADIARKIRALRVGRRMTQATLSRALGLSQGRFSEIERGRGSFTAEQFLAVLKLFNVPLSHFVSDDAPPAAAVQQALVRLGASHLTESVELSPTHAWDDPAGVIREVLLAPESPRHLAALAPVLVRHVDALPLNRLRAQFLDYGLGNRWAWLLENIRAAMSMARPEVTNRRALALLARADLVLSTHLNHPWTQGSAGSVSAAPDLLDADIRSPKTLAEVGQSASPISHRWNIVTRLQPEDFLEALRASGVTHTIPDPRC